MKTPPLLHRMFSPLSISASGMAAQRARLETIARNIANAETTRTAEGGPYQRQLVELEEVKPEGASNPHSLLSSGADALALKQTREEHLAGLPAAARSGWTPGGVRVKGVVKDPSEGRLVYDPSHPDADEKGYVRMPNVDVITEMADLMTTRRAMEANVTAFEAAKSMIRASIEI